MTKKSYKKKVVGLLGVVRKIKKAGAEYIRVFKIKLLILLGLMILKILGKLMLLKIWVENKNKFKK